jgi:pyruvate/2-oxoglutarate dehydrogenase complex dihydrolipoamide acyltransferase (E2) component
MKVLQEITVPHESVNDQSLIVLELFFKSGDQVNKGALIAELETSKNAIGVECDVDGYVEYFCQVDDELEVNAVLARITDEKPANRTSNGSKVTKVKPPVSKAKIDRTIFSKKALEAMALSNLDPNVFVNHDFVSKEDVESFLGSAGPQTKSIVGNNFQNAQPISDDLEKVELKKISSFKRREIEYLSSVQHGGLRSTVNIQVETRGVVNFLNDHLRYFKNALLPVVVYECGKLLSKYREFNAYFSNGSIAFYKEINVGFAVDIGKGLKVIKIPGTHQKTVKEIEEEIFRLSNDYLDDKLKTESLLDTTFTVTDLSSEGVFSFTPLINMKNSAILGLSAIDQNNRCMLSISFDHRVTEGKQSAIFLSELKARIESYNSNAHNAQAKLNQLSLITCYKCFKKLSEDLSSLGFAKCVTPDGNEGYICQSCFKGF